MKKNIEIYPLSSISSLIILQLSEENENFLLFFLFPNKKCFRFFMQWFFLLFFLLSSFFFAEEEGPSDAPKSFVPVPRQPDQTLSSSHPASSSADPSVQQSSTVQGKSSILSGGGNGEDAGAGDGRPGEGQEDGEDFVQETRGDWTKKYDWQTQQAYFVHNETGQEKR